MTVYHEIHRDLLELCREGDSRAQYRLYQLYSRAMYNLCYRMMNNREEAEDMLQESFTDAFRMLDTFRFESSFGAWLKRITVNKCINALKKRKADLIPMEEIPDMQDHKEDPEDVARLTVEQVREAMESLPEGYRVIFSLYLLEGYDHGEISQIMDISESTSKSQYMRARQKIKEILIQNGHGRSI